MIALEIALSLIGSGEDRANNEGAFIDQIFRRESASANWCAAFVSFCLEESHKKTGVEMPFERSGGAKKLFKRVGSSGSFVERPIAGDIVCWDRGKPGSWKGHIGFIFSVHDRHFVSVEGNVGSYDRTKGAVRKIKHSFEDSRLEGFARLP